MYTDFENALYNFKNWLNLIPILLQIQTAKMWIPNPCYILRKCLKGKENIRPWLQVHFADGGNISMCRLNKEKHTSFSKGLG